MPEKYALGARPESASVAMPAGGPPIALLELSSVGIVLGWNPVAEKIFGHPAGAVVGHPLSSLLVDRDAARFESVVGTLSTEGGWDGLVTTLAADGGAATELAVWLSRSRQGIQVAVQETAAWRRAEADRRSCVELEDFFENGPIALHSVGPDGRVLRVNRAELELLGYRREEYVGKRIEDVFADRQTVGDILNRLQRGETVRDQAAQLRRKDGVLIDVMTDGNAYGAAVQSFHTRCFTRDVTELKRREDANRFLGRVAEVLASSLDYEQTIASAARLAVPEVADWCAVHMRLEDGSVRRLALAYRDPGKAGILEALQSRYTLGLDSHYGYPKVLRTGDVEFLPEIPPSLLEVVARDEEHLRLLRALELRSTLSGPLRARRRIIGAISMATGESGRKFTTTDLVLAQELADRAALAIDNALLYISARRELIERERAEAEVRALNSDLERRVRERTLKLEDALRQLEAFRYTVSHDLRAPLRALAGFSDLLLTEYDGRPFDAEGRDYARRIRDAARSMDRLILDLLHYSAVNRAAIELKPVDLGAVVRGVLSVLEAELSERDALVLVDEPLPRVLAHEVLLSQAITNLVSNAAKFVRTGERPWIQIRAEAGERVRLWVEDHGIGISPEHHERIFRVFERLHAKAEYAGTGVGLSIVAKAVEHVGGRVGVESELGKGSRFWIELRRDAG